MVSILGIEATPSLLESWVGWLAPDPQPFLLAADHPWPDEERDTGIVTPETRDTFRLWGATAGSKVVWLSENRFSSLPKARRAALVREQVTRRCGVRPGVGGVPSVRGWSDVLDADALRDQADGHRFVWWQSLVAADPTPVFARLLSTGRLTSRHGEVSESTWRTCEGVLPAARQLAGTFPMGSDTCCFGTVMAAAGADDSLACGAVEPFTDWLNAVCRKGGDSQRPGTVLVWRNQAGEPVHAAVTVGGGWVLEKPSQEWHSPRAVATVADVVRASRYPGQRLERHTIVT